MVERIEEYNYIIGIDASITSSGIVKALLDNNCDIIKIDYLGFSDIKKIAYTNSNIRYYKKENFKNYIERYLWCRDVILDFVNLPWHRVFFGNIGYKINKYVAIEDYSFASTAGLIFNIAEFTFSIKEKLYEMGAKLRFYDPCSIKLFGNGKGNADKVMMSSSYEANNDKDKINLDKLVVCKSPHTDIVDAWFIMKLLQLEIKLRKGLIQLKDLDETKIRIFNKVSKKYDTNLLAMDFLEK